MKNKIIPFFVTGCFIFISCSKVTYKINDCISSKTSDGQVYVEKIISVNENTEKYQVRLYSNGSWHKGFRETSFKFAHDKSEYNIASCPEAS